MNEFAINWIKGGTYAEITVPSGTALKSKLLKLAKRKPNEVNHVIINKVSPPRKISDEQAAAASDRFKQMWEEKKSESNLN